MSGGWIVQAKSRSVSAREHVEETARAGRSPPRWRAARRGRRASSAGAARRPRAPHASETGGWRARCAAPEPARPGRAPSRAPPGPAGLDDRGQRGRAVAPAARARAPPRAPPGPATRGQLAPGAHVRPRARRPAAAGRARSVTCSLRRRPARAPPGRERRAGGPARRRRPARQRVVDDEPGARAGAEVARVRERHEREQHPGDRRGDEEGTRRSRSPSHSAHT